MSAESTSEQDGLQRASFYFSAHEDDWQLFMNPPAFRDVLDGVKCVFVHVTAGDAGLGLGNGGRKHPLYLAREHGAESAIRFMADQDHRPPVEKTVAAVACNGHALRRVGYRNTVSYFLRLPDGNPEGTGYAATGDQSLKRLAEGRIESFTAIDASAVYQSWSDLVATLHALIEIECTSAPAIDLHIPDPDPVINPGDHADHIMTAKAVLDAARDLAGVRVVQHLGYASGSRPENLSGIDRDMKCAVYAVTLAGVLALDHETAWRHYDQSFVGRDYWRTPGPA
jgi:hypothetical protein